MEILGNVEREFWDWLLAKEDVSKLRGDCGGVIKLGLLHSECDKEPVENQQLSFSILHLSESGDLHRHNKRHTHLKQDRLFTSTQSYNELRETTSTFLNITHFKQCKFTVFNDYISNLSPICVYATTAVLNKEKTSQTSYTIYMSENT